MAVRGSHSIEIVTKREIMTLVGVGVGLALVGMLVGLTGLVPLRVSIAATMLIFLALFLVHFKWRYGPLKAAVGSISNEDFEGAMTILDGYLSSTFNRGGRSRSLAQVLKASCLFYLEKFDEATELSTKILKDSDCETIRFFAQNNVVSCYICLRKPLKAHAERAKILTLNVGNDGKRHALTNIGLCYMNCEFFREAIETWDEALKLFPSDEQKAYILGFQAACYNRIRSYENALEKCQEARNLQPSAPLTRAIILDNVSFALANRKERLDEAYKFVKDALALKVKAAEPHLHMTLGEVHYARGEFDEALEEFNFAIERISKRDKNSRQKALLTLGKIYQAKGMGDEAKDCLNKAISIDPTKTLAIHAQQVLKDPKTHNTAMPQPGEALDPLVE